MFPNNPRQRKLVTPFATTASQNGTQAALSHETNCHLSATNFVGYD